MAESLRSAFEQDYDRIVFSHPFRRLQDKTQVHPLPEHDFVHTRLTHSLEASSVARTLGRKVGETILARNPGLQNQFSLFDFGSITAASTLAHDLGNPPFGHAGEEAISAFFLHHQGQAFQQQVSPEEWSDLVSFEGNAQGFRIINHQPYGMKLTYAVMGAFTKYPRPALMPNKDPQRKSQKKFGYFQTEKTLFEGLAQHLGLLGLAPDTWVRHPLAFLVEAADDICYNIIDLEDGCRLGLVSLNETIDLLEGILKDNLDREKLNRFQGLNEKLGVLRALSINALIENCTEVFLDHEADILSGKFDQALTDLCQYRDALKAISALSFEKIYRAQHVIEIEAAGHQVLPGLLEEFTQGITHEGKKNRKHENMMLLLPPEIRHQLALSPSLYEKLRCMIDFVSGLTDRHALSLYRKIKGMAF